jgi:hypothetical protein
MVVLAVLLVALDPEAFGRGRTARAQPNAPRIGESGHTSRSRAPRLQRPAARAEVPAMSLTGTQYANLVAGYVLKNFGHRGLTVYREVPFGKTIIGKNRRVDIVLIEESTRTAMAIECKYQDSLGTADEKIPYALADIATIGMPVCLAYAGEGFSEGIRHMLAASAHRGVLPARREPRAHGDATRELDAALARTFKWWDLVVRGKTPFKL